MTLNIGVIGTGAIGQDHTRRINQVLAGASAVQIYTALVYEGLSLAARIARGLEAIAAREGFARVSDATGTGRDRWL